MPHADDSCRVLYRAKYVQRLPGRLEELTGPREGVGALPLHVAWSGLREFRLDRPRQRMGLYLIVPAEGLHDDLCAYLNPELLIAQWPIMRTLISRTVREVRETAFPQLQAAGASGSRDPAVRPAAGRRVHRRDPPLPPLLVRGPSSVPGGNTGGDLAGEPLRFF